MFFGGNAQDFQIVIIFKNDKVVNAVPGGSTFNAMVSLGRSGVPVNFLSQTGNDRIGKYVIKFLDENGVNSSYVNITPYGKSPISLAFLDEQNKPDYLFYHDQQHDEIEFNYPDVQRDDIVLFGSYFAINPDVRAQVDGFLKYAKEQGAILYYDVNFVINNQQILDAHYTGKFRTHDGIEHVIRVLALNNKFTYIKDNESNTITIN